MPHTQKPAQVGATIAAIDMGSNSFHLAIARVMENNVQILHRVKQRVSLAEGMDKQGNLAPAAMQRGWDCLAQFAQRLQESQISAVRLVATYALRQAPNRHDFLAPARDILDAPIEVIAGREEARLIFHGVSHAEELNEPTLVIDIGGGSTELIIGQDGEPFQLESLNMGCVSFQDRFFNEGKLSHKRFDKAIVSAQQQLEPLLERYRRQGWQATLGTSGTIKALAQVCQQEFEKPVITRKSLEKLVDKLAEAGHIDKMGMEYLSDTRRPVLPAGLSVLLGCFRALNIDEMRFCDAALREGVIFEMANRVPQASVCQHTVEAMQRLYHVDTQHARRVADTACQLYRAQPQHDEELEELLYWSGQLHEVGLALNSKGVQRHSGYIIANGNMAGFHLEQQQLLAFLGRWHRKRLDDCELPSLQLAKPTTLQRLLICLRLSVLWHLGRRHRIELPEVEWGKREVRLTLPAPLADDALLLADLEQENELLQTLGWELQFH
ncbi:exopolyphosphatase [Ferrimonas balearica]|uniref:exopolyphosphatase n=1 Tax=Ferrimonas balearica TaxID=44012 RepID=UPI001C56EABA|nr:exopolyphosphatase [Ferrimonas balearica]MBW3140010.1 exopolyphosphatase [Ferrimonas balearica]MBY6106882.1 exopolyphosphatase [Ferrimonas balearica]